MFNRNNKKFLMHKALHPLPQPPQILTSSTNFGQKEREVMERPSKNCLQNIENFDTSQELS